MKDLFGKEISVDAAIRYKSVPQAKGYAGTPGSGPKGETCGTCLHSYSRSGGSRNYYKCDLVKATHGLATDIRIRWPACHRWEKKTT